MCGIVGQYGSFPGETGEWLDAAVASLEHRGPDDSGTWADPERSVWLGHRRLSILDLSPGGHQPFVSADGRYVLVFNGEIYNHVALRTQLAGEGWEFRTTCDTEVLMVAIQRWGLEDALRRCNGMFALALWDRDSGRVGLARDRLGEKPLFVQLGGGGAIRFASELKALWAGGRPRPGVDRDSLVMFLRLGYVVAPRSIFENVVKVRPGTVRWFSADGDREVRFWQAPDGHADVAPVDLDELEALLRDSVGLRMQADVPVGAFLSGGIDSSLISALMVAHGGTVRTFTIGFTEQRFDESKHAAAIARHLGTEHVELILSPEDARAVVPRLPSMFDEPFADQSAIPTFLVAELARRDVTVSLSGDGGDELFGGYSWYRRLGLGAPFVRIPRPLSAAVVAGARSAGSNQRLAARARKLERLAMAVNQGTPQGMFRNLISLWESPEELVVDGREPNSVLNDGSRWPAGGAALTRVAMAADLVTFLPDDILVKLDRTSMAVSLEARVPLLDHRVVEYAFTHGRPNARRGAQMKLPLRQLLARHVPPALYERPKMGFVAPMGTWLRGPLRSWAEELLDAGSLRDSGLFHPEPIRARWESHLAGATDQSYPLWAVLTFEAWRREWLGA